MAPGVDHQQLMIEIENLYASAPSGAENLIEAYLENRLRSLEATERLACLEKLIAETGPQQPVTAAPAAGQVESLSRLFSLLLGKDVSAADLTSGEMTDRLLDSFNTVFDNLNRLIRSINTTLFGEGAGDKTIRHMIGEHIDGDAEVKSLESYIGQIDKAFLITHQAFQGAVRQVVRQIMDELDPEAIVSAGSGGLKLGVVKRAEFFDTYEDKYAVIHKWFESDRFRDRLLREFEKQCRQLSESGEE
jgi:hypothetical protein